MKKIYVILVLFLVTTISACAQPVAGEIVKSDKTRIESPTVDQSDLGTLVSGNSTFAFQLYQKLAEKDGNLFYSPYSISAALAMTYAGAKNDTEQQMAKTLYFLLPPDKLHPAFNSLDLELHSRGKGAKGKDDNGFRLHVVNAIWGQKNYTFLNTFLDTLAQNYGAGLRILDFIQSPENSRLTINKWVSDQTKDRIKDLIPPRAIDIMTRLVLTNAIYFNAAWQFPFSEDSTSPDQFVLLDGSKVSVPMMGQTESFAYFQGNGYQAIELPYDGRELSMIVLVPDRNQFKAIEKSIDFDLINKVIQGLEVNNVLLTMPKFEFESEFQLAELLEEMGMHDAFNPESADFSGMTGDSDLYISRVIHKAFVSIDEAGTEAAAATAVIMRATAMPAQPVKLKIDRPFLFLIRDIKTGAILFIGRVLNPMG